jgi:hypothetical protein
MRRSYARRRGFARLGGARQDQRQSAVNRGFLLYALLPNVVRRLDPRRHFVMRRQRHASRAPA